MDGIARCGQASYEGRGRWLGHGKRARRRSRRGCEADIQGPASADCAELSLAGGATRSCVTGLGIKSTALASGPWQPSKAPRVAPVG